MGTLGRVVSLFTGVAAKALLLLSLSVFGAQVFAGISATPNPSTGSFTLNWTYGADTIVGYRVYENGTSIDYIAGHATSRSKSFSNKPVGTYTYLVKVTVTQIETYEDENTGDEYEEEIDYTYTVGSITVTVHNPTPATPAGLNAPTSDGNGAYTVSWSSTAHASTYQLQRRLSGGSWSTIHNSSTTSRSESGLGNGVWEYRVRACNSAGSCSGYSGVDSTQVAIAPGVPGTASISPSTSYTGSHSLTWGAASGSVTKYDVDKRFNGGSWSNAYDGTSRNRTFSGLSTGTHQYAIRACRTTGSYTNCSAWRYSSNATVTVPSAVSQPNAPTNDNNGAYSVSWSGSTGATSYQLQRQANGGSWSTIQTSSATSRSESGLGNAVYGYRVRACSAVGCSAYSPVDTTQVAITPGVPSSITTPGTNYSGTVSLSWGAASGSVSYYDLNKQFNSGSWVGEYDGSALSRTDTGLVVGNYRYAVRACRTTGSYTSCSGWRYGNTFAVTTPATPGTPNAPSGDPDGAYSVSWSTTTGATSYELQRQTNGGSWSTIHNASGTSRSESGLGTATYGYRVRACSAVGCSGYSGVDSTDVAIAPSVSPSISISPQHTTNSTHTVSWGASTGTVAMYRLEQQKDGGGWLEVYSGGATSRAINNLMTGSYHYRVRACNTQGSYQGCSGYRTTTNAGSVATPGTPSGLSAPATDNDGSFTVNWNASGGANSYTLQQRLGSGAWSNIHTSGATSKAVSGLGNGSYQFRVQACNVSGCSVYSSAVTTHVAIAPGVPSSISASPSTSPDGNHTVNWGTASGTLTTYDMDRRVNGGSWTNEQDTSARSKAYSGQSDGTYEYRVRACHTVGSNTQCSGWRTAAAVTVLLPPGTPGSTSVPTTNGTGSYTVTWTAGNGTTVDYLLQEQINGGSWADVTTTASTSYAVTGKGDGNYSYRVRANNGSGSSGWSATDTVAVIHVPGTPGAISGPAQSYGSGITLTWGSAAGSVGYYSLEQRKDGGSWGVVDSGSDRTYTAGTLTEGTYDYRVRAFNSSGGGGYTAVHSVAVAPHTPPPAAPTAHVEPAPSVNAGEVIETDSVGTIAGSFRVDESGSATYSIPIATAAGTAGVAPQLSLNYSSQGGNGLAGLGWNIGGLSGISRSRQTLQQDGDPMPITWGPEDRFALDGQRLILVSGTYGAPDSEYRTEIDSFAQIYARGGSTGHPDYWEVHRKDGSTSFYGDVPTGNFTDAKQNNTAGQTLTWALKKFQDSVGNPIWFDYHNDADGHRIEEVKYAYGSAGGPSGSNARVRFTYGSRNDVTRGYVAGYEFSTGQRLTSVTSYNTGGSGETALRTYHLKYLDQSNNGTSQSQPATDDLSRLTSIEECVDSRCLPATTFDWALPSVGIAANPTSTTNISPTQSGDDFILDYRPADINGDGRMDLVWLEASTNNHGNIDRHALYYALANNTGGLGSRIKAYEDFEFGGGVNEAYKIEVIDYNADGRMDVLLWDNNYHQPGKADVWRVHLSTPQGNGGWLLSTTGFTSGTGIPAEKDLTLLDVNSDGLVDIVQGDQVYLMEPDPSEPVTSNRFYRFGAAITIDYPRNASGQAYWYAPRDHWDPHEILGSPSDFDGDGRVDFIGRVYGHNWCTETDINDEEVEVECNEISYRHVWLNRGYDSSTNTIKTEALATTTVSSPNSRDYYDFNGDGAADILTGSRLVRLSKGNGSEFMSVEVVVPYPAENDTETSYQESLNNNNAQQIQVVDYNRDGYQDIVWFDYEANYLKVRYWNGDGFDPAANIKYISGSDEDQKKHRFQFMDVNADGIPDVVQFDTEYGGANTSKVYLSTQQNVPTNRITGVTNGLGAETNITYGTLATSGHYQRVNVGSTVHTYDGPCFPDNPYDEDEEEFDPDECHYTYSTANVGDFYSMLNGGWDVQSSAHTLGKDVNDDGQRDPVLELNGPMYIVTDVASSAPAADDANPGTVDNNATSSISYYYGEAKVQAMGRGFLGFQRLRTVDNQTGVMTTTTYRQDFPFIGSPLQTIVTTDDGHVLSMSENIWKLKHWDENLSDPRHVDWNGTSMPDTKLYAPYLARSIEKTYDLASNGSAQGAHLQTVTTDNLYDSYGNPLTITVTTDDETGSDQFVKTTTNTYGTSTWEREMGRLSRTQVVSTRSGSVADTETRTSAFTYITSGDKRGLLATEVIEPDNVAYRLTTTYQYDNFGNKLRATTSGAGVTSRYSRSEYDALGRYVERSFNSLEQKTSEVVTRNGYGQVTQARDLNGLDVVSAYSPLGRKYFERGETGGFSKTYLTDADTSHCPTGTVYKAISHSAGGGQSQQCFDKLGRAIRSLSVGFSGNWIASDVEFDTLGRTKRQSEPYYLDSGSPIYWTTIDYDILGRPTTTTLPDNSTGSVQYNGYSTVTINDKGHRKVETKNALGEVVGVTDNEGAVVMKPPRSATPTTPRAT
ncbi:VCBS repeat-containing protein [bacterium SCSIO 12696]|nr:VCBS repeat-containing protein [bacterium SCSIO 12696]